MVMRSPLVEERFRLFRCGKMRFTNVAEPTVREGPKMRVNQTSSISHPLSVTADLLDRLNAIFQDARESTCEALARKHSIDVKEVKRIGTLSSDQLSYPEYPKESDRESYEQYRKLTAQRSLEISVASDLRTETIINYSVKYDSGLRTGTDSIEQLKGILHEEAGKVELISADYGEYGRTRVNVRLGGSITTASFDISGDRKDVDFIYRSISDALKGSTPDHPFLHWKWLQFLVAVVVSTLFVSAGLDFFGVQIVKAKDLATTYTVESLLRATIGIPLILYLTSVMEKAFPKCQVELGPDWRHQRALRTRLFAIISVILIPVLINVFV